jgi:hypothetical protein
MSHVCRACVHFPLHPGMHSTLAGPALRLASKTTRDLEKSVLPERNRLVLQLEEEKIKIKEKNKVQVASFGNKFGKSAGDLVAEELGKKTVGLVTLEELRKCVVSRLDLSHMHFLSDGDFRWCYLLSC